MCMPPQAMRAAGAGSVLLAAAGLGACHSRRNQSRRRMYRRVRPARHRRTSSRAASCKSCRRGHLGCARRSRRNRFRMRISHSGSRRRHRHTHHLRRTCRCARSPLVAAARSAATAAASAGCQVLSWSHNCMRVTGSTIGSHPTASPSPPTRSTSRRRCRQLGTSQTQS